MNETQRWQAKVLPVFQERRDRAWGKYVDISEAVVLDLEKLKAQANVYNRIEYKTRLLKY